MFNILYWITYLIFSMAKESKHFSTERHAIISGPLENKTHFCLNYIFFFSVLNKIFLYLFWYLQQMMMESCGLCFQVCHMWEWCEPGSIWELQVTESLMAYICNIGSWEQWILPCILCIDPFGSSRSTFPFYSLFTFLKIFLSSECIITLPKGL